MSWQINDDELPRQDYELTKERLDDQPRYTQERDQGKLFFVDSREHSVKPRKFLAPHIIDFHKRLVSKIGVDVIVPFGEIEALFPELSKLKARSIVTRLWVDGYLEKYVKGFYGMGRNNWRGKTNNWRGKYFGVHYKILSKKYL